jgi:hypothetical protein
VDIGDLARHSSSAVGADGGGVRRRERKELGVMKVMGRGSVSSFLAGMINIGWYGAMVLLALSICLLALAPWVDPPRIEVSLELPVAFRVEAEPRHLSASPSGVEHVHLEKARGSLVFSPQSRLVAEAAVLLIVLLALVMWVLGQLRAVFRTLRAGKPFVAANATRIRRIAYAVILGEFLRSAFVYLGTHYAMTHFLIQGLRLETRWDLSIGAIIAGLIILVIAEVFREGTRLDEEQSLTV